MATEEAGVQINTELDPKGLQDFATRLKALKKEADELKRAGAAAGRATEHGLKESSKAAQGLSKDLKNAQRDIDKLKANVAKARGGLIGEMFPKQSMADAGRSIAGGITGSIKMASMAATAGAIAIVRGNMQAEKSFRKVAFAQVAAGKATANWSDLSKKSHQTVQKYGGDQESTAQGMATLLQKTGNADFATQGIDAVAMAASASGVEIKTLAELAGELNDKFGVTAQEMPDALGQMIELAAKGGQSVEELTANMDGLGKSAARAGVTGVGGLAKMVALSQQMADQVGGEGVAMKGLGKIMTTLGPDADAKTKAKLKQMGVKGTGIDQLESLMKVTGGDQAKLGQVLSPEQAALLSTGLGKTGFGEAMGRAGSTTLTGAKLQGMSDDAQNSPGKKLEKALDTIAAGLDKPEARAAIDSIISRLPALAEALVKGADFITKHPLLSGGLFAASQSGGLISALGGLAKSGMDVRAAQSALAAATAAQTLASGGSTVAVTGLGTAATGASLSMAKLGGAALLAVAAWAIAYDQWTKLTPELQKHKEEQEEQRQTAINTAMMRGDKSVEFDGVELAVSGKDKDGKWISETLNKERSDEDIAADRAKTSSVMGTYNELYEAKERQGEALAASRVGSPEWKAANPGVDPNAPAKLFKTSQPDADTPDKPGGAAKPAQSAADKALFDAMMASSRDLPSKLGAQELKVRVVNASDFGDQPPGHSPRK